MHNLYAFNDEGKITMMAMYYDDDVFEEIGNSMQTKENGTVYINEKGEVIHFHIYASSNHFDILE